MYYTQAFLYFSTFSDFNIHTSFFARIKHIYIYLLSKTNVYIFYCLHSNFSSFCLAYIFFGEWGFRQLEPSISHPILQVSLSAARVFQSDPPPNVSTSLFTVSFHNVLDPSKDLSPIGFWSIMTLRSVALSLCDPSLHFPFSKVFLFW